MRLRGEIVVSVLAGAAWLERRPSSWPPCQPRGLQVLGCCGRPWVDHQAEDRAQLEEGPQVRGGSWPQSKPRLPGVNTGVIRCAHAEVTRCRHQLCNVRGSSWRVSYSQECALFRCASSIQIRSCMSAPVPLHLGRCLSARRGVARFTVVRSCGHGGHPPHAAATCTAAPGVGPLFHNFHMPGPQAPGAGGRA
jgi:hypothetical protein